MIKYKVLNADFRSPFQVWMYALGRTETCTNFDADPSKDCAPGLYATGIEGLLYSYRPGRIVVECEVGGQAVEYDQFKQRYETLTPIRVVEIDELKELVTLKTANLGYNLYEAMWPINPLKLEPNEISEKLIREWTSIGDSVGDSIGDSVGDSIGDSVWTSVKGSVWTSVGNSVWTSVKGSVRASVRDSVRASVRDSVRAYMSSLFPQIQKWNGINHVPGVNPYQSGIDMWKSGVVPSFDGKVWRLHGHKDARILREIKL